MKKQTVTPIETPKVTIYAGATFRKYWRRLAWPYPTKVTNNVVYKLDGSPAPEVDRVLDDYTGCKVIAELRDTTSDALLHTFSTENNGVLIDGEYIGLEMLAGDTDALDAFTDAVAYIEVRRLNDDIERPFVVPFGYSPSKTAVQPAAL
ncbi:MAG: hypothetical protein KDG57_13920 [Rhodoferax sp.]|nr:hypothetical protein [Rhodoferax sp.]